MKILLFGRGVIAALYGWAFEKAGHTVHFYVRPGSAEKYGSTINLNLVDGRSKGGAVNEVWKVQLVEEVPTDHDYDLILLSVPHYKFAEAAAFLAPRVAKATVLIFNNFWKDPQEAAAVLPAGQLAWGFPQAGGGFASNQMLNGALFKNVHFGTFGTAPTEREVAARKLFESAGFTVDEHRDFKGWLWIHFAVITGFFAAAQSAGTVGRVMESGTAGKRAILLIRELLPIAAARGVDLRNNKAEYSLYNLPAWFGSFMLRTLTQFNRPFRAAFASPFHQEEAKAFRDDMLAEARRLSVPVPLLEAAV